MIGGRKKKTMSYYGSYRYRNNKSSASTVIVVVFIIIVVISVWIGISRSWSKGTDINEYGPLTVTDKQVKNDDGDGKYLIFAEDSQGEILVFEVTDSWIYGRFDSSNVYGSIHIGETYIFKAGGYRDEFMSYYPNIYEFTVVSE